MKSLVVILLLCFLLNATNGDEECTFRDLEKALYEPENFLALSTAFFPVKQRTSRQFQVHYTFEGNETSSACTVTYFWAVGGLLLIQPPKILQFTSLLFSFLSNNIENIFVIFPQKCQYLVYNEDKSNCSCQGQGDKMLNILTHHLFQYAKYNSPDQVVRDETSAVRSVCRENLADFTGPPIAYFFIFTLLISIPLLVLVLLGVLRYRKTIETKLLEEDKHINMVGLGLTGICIILFILAMDIAAVYFTGPNKNEYKNTNIESSLNLKITYCTLTFDLISVALYITGVIFSRYGLIDRLKRLSGRLKCNIKLCCKNIRKNRKSIQSTDSKYGAVDSQSSLSEEEHGEGEHGGGEHGGGEHGVGEHGGEERGEEAQAETSCHVQYMWYLFRIIYPTCFCISTHLGYILAAWLTEPKKTSCIALFAIATILFLYLSFRKSYELSCLIWSNREKLCELHNWNSPNLKTISWPALGISFIFGVLIIGMLIAAVLAFWLLPIPALELTVYLENILEIILLFGAALISYKILSFKESDAYIFLKSFMGCFEADRRQGPPNATNSDEAHIIKESGETVGEILKAVGKKYDAKNM